MFQQGMWLEVTTRKHFAACSFYTSDSQYTKSKRIATVKLKLSIRNLNVKPKDQEKGK